MFALTLWAVEYSYMVDGKGCSAKFIEHHSLPNEWWGYSDAWIRYIQFGKHVKWRSYIGLYVLNYNPLPPKLSEAQVLPSPHYARRIFK